MHVLMVMSVLVRVCHFGLLGSLIRLCHLSRGQILAFQEASMSAASQRSDERGLSLITTVRGFDREGQTLWHAHIDPSCLQTVGRARVQ
jgi:hypothetical protein